MSSWRSKGVTKCSTTTTALPPTQIGANLMRCVGTTASQVPGFTANEHSSVMGYREQAPTYGLYRRISLDGLCSSTHCRRRGCIEQRTPEVAQTSPLTPVALKQAPLRKFVPLFPTRFQEGLECRPQALIMDAAGGLQESIDFASQHLFAPNQALGRSNS